MIRSIFQRKPPRTITWGPWKLPLKQREDHFLFLGTSGAGKTLSLTQQYATVLPHITPDSSERVIIYDKKGDALPILWALNEQRLIHKDITPIFFNPLDRRTHTWDIAADVAILPKNQLDTPFHRIVTNLFPLQKDAGGKHDRFFYSKLVDLAKLVLHGFAAAGIRWSLRDLFSVITNETHRNKVITLGPRGRESLGKLGDDDTIRNIEASVAADLVPFGELANLMQLAADQTIAPQRNKTFTIHEFLSNPGILVFSGTTNPDVPLAHLNRTFLTELIEQLAKGNETRTDITWIFLDEVASLGSQRGLVTLLREGRSKGASVFLGLQDIPGFRAALGNPDEAASVLGQIKNTAFFKTPDHESAEWASLRCGTWRRIDPLENRMKTEPRFNSTYFQDLNKFSAERGLPGVFRTSTGVPQEAVIKPLLLKGLDSREAWKPLGTVPWPGNADPQPNLELERLLGISEATRCEKRAPGVPPSTGRIGPSNAA